MKYGLSDLDSNSSDDEGNSSFLKAMSDHEMDSGPSRDDFIPPLHEQLGGPPVSEEQRDQSHQNDETS
ncbi:hypothetical protein K3495_g4778 [Podosphaera aphanis]|nr:hypothetical protein K3495_g4778 [Podosphaera aphanis]